MSEEKEEYKDYLGDGVYVKFDGYHIVLYLDNGFGPHSPIALEPDVMDKLARYTKRIDEMIQLMRANQLNLPSEPGGDS